MDKARRTVSMKRDTFERLKAACGDTPMASVVEMLIATWLEAGAPMPKPKQSDLAVDDLAETRTILNARRAARQSVIPDAERVERSRREYIARAEIAPCRREKCSIVGLHPVHT
jgi:hypothetical protein